MPEFHDPMPEVVPRPAPQLDWRERARAVADHPASGIVALAVIGLVAAGFWYRAGSHRSAAAARAAPAVARRPDVTRGNATTTSALGADVVVHVSGAVAHAGLYHLPSSARVADAITAAGGPTTDADVNRVNLAARVIDGQHIVVPRLGESLPDITGDQANKGPVSLNNASLQELETLPRIGPTLGQAIIDYRTRHGGFKTISELGNVRGIGDQLLADLRPLVVL